MAFALLARPPDGKPALRKAKGGSATQHGLAAGQFTLQPGVDIGGQPVSMRIV